MTVPPAKRRTARKSAAKRTTARKPAKRRAKKTTARKSTARKTTRRRKSTAKKAPAKRRRKAAAKKAPAKRRKKAVAKKAPAKKRRKKAVAKKAPAKRRRRKATTAKKAPAKKRRKKAVAKKAPAKKSAQEGSGQEGSGQASSSQGDYRQEGSGQASPQGHEAPVEQSHRSTDRGSLTGPPVRVAARRRRIPVPTGRRVRGRGTEDRPTRRRPEPGRRRERPSCPSPAGGLRRGAGGRILRRRRTRTASRWGRRGRWCRRRGGRAPRRRSGGRRRSSKAAKDRACGRSAWAITARVRPRSAKYSTPAAAAALKLPGSSSTSIRALRSASRASAHSRTSGALVTTTICIGAAAAITHSAILRMAEARDWVSRCSASRALALVNERIGTTTPVLPFVPSGELDGAAARGMGCICYRRGAGLRLGARRARSPLRLGLHWTIEGAHRIPVRARAPARDRPSYRAERLIVVGELIVRSER